MPWRTGKDLLGYGIIRLLLLSSLLSCSGTQNSMDDISTEKTNSRLKFNGQLPKSHRIGLPRELLQSQEVTAVSSKLL